MAATKPNVPHCSRWETNTLPSRRSQIRLLLPHALSYAGNRERRPGIPPFVTRCGPCAQKTASSSHWGLHSETVETCGLSSGFGVRCSQVGIPAHLLCSLGLSLNLSGPAVFSVRWGLQVPEAGEPTVCAQCLSEGTLAGGLQRGRPRRSQNPHNRSCESRADAALVHGPAQGLLPREGGAFSLSLWVEGMVGAVCGAQGSTLEA